jgi:hypothetical protein
MRVPCLCDHPDQLAHAYHETKLENKTHTAIQCGTRDIVVLAPPLKIALANDKLEYEPDREPGRVVDARRWRDEGYTD